MLVLYGTKNSSDISDMMQNINTQNFMGYECMKFKIFPFLSLNLLVDCFESVCLSLSSIFSTLSFLLLQISMITIMNDTSGRNIAMMADIHLPVLYPRKRALFHEATKKSMSASTPSELDVVYFPSINILFNIRAMNSSTVAPMYFHLV